MIEAKLDGWDGINNKLLLIRTNAEKNDNKLFGSGTTYTAVSIFEEWVLWEHEWTYRLINKIKAGVPPGLDKLRDSVHFDPQAREHPENSVAGEHMAYVSIDDPSARFVEYGTPHVAARPFVRPAIDAIQKDFASWMRGQGEKIVLRILWTLITGGLG